MRTTPSLDKDVAARVQEETRRRQAGFKALAIAGVLAAGLFWGFEGTASAQEGGLYVGVTGMAERPRVFYEKTVDNTDPRNVSPSRGRLYRADDTAVGAAYAAGFLAGYRLPLGAGGAYLGPEVDVALGGDAVQGRFEGAGFSEGRNQLGEAWPEDWSFEAGRSYGLTVRLGVATGSGVSVYGLAGLRRLKATFSADYTGCFSTMLCTPGEFVSGTDVRDEDFAGWTAGGGLEKKLGNTSVRGEMRYTDYRGSNRVVSHDDLAITVPLALEARGIGVLASLIWHF